MKKILMLSYISKEIEGRVNRIYSVFNNNPNLDLLLIQKCNESTKSEENNVINLYTKHDSGLKSYFEFVKQVVKYLKKQTKYDYIYLNNYYCAPFSHMLKREKCIYDAYELVYPGYGKRITVHDYFFYLFEKDAIKNSKVVIAANEERALIMTGHYNLRKIPIVIDNFPLVYNRKVNDNDKRINGIVYAGYITEETGIMELIKAVNIYNESSSQKLILALYGMIALKKDLKQLGDCIEYHGSYEWHNLDSILQKYKYGYVAYTNSNFNVRFCAPNKLGDYINNGNIVISNNNYYLSKMIKKYEIGYSCDDMLIGITYIIQNYKQLYSNIEKTRDELESADKYKELFAVIFN